MGTSRNKKMSDGDANTAAAGGAGARELGNGLVLDDMWDTSGLDSMVLDIAGQQASAASKAAAAAHVAQLEAEVAALRRALSCFVVPAGADVSRSSATLVFSDIGPSPLEQQPHHQPDGLIVGYCGLCLMPHTSFSSQRACVMGHVRPVRCYSGACQERLPTIGAAREHFERRHPGETPKLFCIKCGADFSSPSEMRQHGLKHAEEACFRSVVFRCNVCGDASVPPEKFAEHVRTAHGSLRAGAVVFPDNVPPHCLPPDLQVLYHEQKALFPPPHAPSAPVPSTTAFHPSPATDLPPESGAPVGEAGAPDADRAKTARPRKRATVSRKRPRGEDKGGDACAAATQPDEEDDEKAPGTGKGRSKPKKQATKRKAAERRRRLCTACKKLLDCGSASLAHTVICAQNGEFDFLDPTHRFLEFADAGACALAQKRVTEERSIAVIDGLEPFTDLTCAMFSSKKG